MGMKGSPGIQIFGTKKCNNTRKAERFFKERHVAYHFVDLTRKPMSRGELESVLRSLSPEELLDTESKEYEKQNLKYMLFDPVEKLLENPLLFRTPVIRCGREATAGYAPQKWEAWLKS